MTMKNIILNIALLTISLNCFAQTAYFKVKDEGRLEKIERVSTGGYITLGEDSSGFHEITRWDENFNPSWVVKITDQSPTPFSRYIVEANDGNFYATANSSYNSGVFYVIKISKTGTVLWQKHYAATSSSVYFSALAFSKAAGNDNGFIFGVGNCSASNLLVKCDENGTIVWKKKYNHSLANGIISCWSILADGNGYVASSGFNTKALMNYKIDATGNLQSQKVYTFSGTTSIMPAKIIKTSTGYAQLVTNNNSKNGTMAVAYYNNSLVLQSLNEITVTNPYFTLFDLTAVNGSEVVLSGTVKNNRDNISTIKLSNTGVLVFEKVAEAETSHFVKNVIMRGVSTTANNEIIQVGYEQYGGAVVNIMDLQGNGLCNAFTGSATSTTTALNLESVPITVSTGFVTESTANYSTSSVSNFNRTVHCGNLPNSIHNQNERIQQINIYPNPTSSTISIQHANNMQGNYDIRIIGLDGKEIMSVSNVTQSIDVSRLNTGIYFMHISTKGESIGYKKITVLQ